MKKINVVLSAALSIFALPAFSYETSALLNNTSEIYFDNNDYDTLKLDQSDSLTLSVKVPFSDTGMTYFAAEGNVKYSYKKADSSESEITANLDVFKFSTTAVSDSSSVSFSAGRYSVSDTTSLVYNQVTDGLGLQFSNSYVDLALNGGYTGLLNSKNLDILDKEGNVYSSTEEKDIYDFAVPYIVADLSVSFPYLFANQTLTLEGLFLKGTEGPGSADSADDMRVYGTLALEGGLSSSLFYTLSSTVYMNKDSDMANLSSLTFAFFPDFHNSAVMVSGTYASGKQGSLVPFTGFTKASACASTEEPSYSSLLKGGIALSMKPVDKVLLMLSGDAVFDFMEETPEYNGLQVAFNSTFQIFTDLSLGLSASTYYAENTDNNKTSITLSALVAF